MGWINEIKNAKKSCDTATLRLQVYWDGLYIFLYIHNSHIFLHAGFPGFLQNNIIHLLHKCSWDFILRNTLMMMMYWTDLMLYCLKKEALNSWLVKSKAYGYRRYWDKGKCKHGPTCFNSDPWGRIFETVNRHHMQNQMIRILSRNRSQERS